MSKQSIREMAAAEAARAEAENPDEVEEAAAEEETETPPAEPVEPPAPEPGAESPVEPEPPAEQPAEPEPAGQGSVDAGQVEQLEKAQASYLAKVRKIIGAERMPPLCPTCEGTALDFTGGAGEPDYRPASNTVTCPECDGLLGVLSGAKLGDSVVIRCGRCKGAGYLVEGPAAVEDPDMVAPVVLEMREGGGNGDQAAALAPGDPGWEPWMGGAPADATAP
jgi:hypothetical protein